MIPYYCTHSLLCLHVHPYTAPLYSPLAVDILILAVVSEKLGITRDAVLLMCALLVIIDAYR